MPKYRNATNKVLVVNGIRLPPGGVIEATEAIAKQAQGALQYMPEGPQPRVVAVPSDSKGMTNEEREKLNRLESMFEQMMETMPMLMQQMQENLKEEIKNNKPQIVEKTITVQGTGGGEHHIREEENEPIPVILDEPTKAVESNLSDSTDTKEKDAKGVKSKLDKLKKLKENK